MPSVHLVPLQLKDAGELLSFELENRSFFEARINARPQTFYSLFGVRASIEDAVRRAQEDSAYQYLVRDDAQSLIGRVNLTRVRRAHFHSAELGYRIAQPACGKGYAKEAVAQVLGKAFGDLGLVRLEATTTPVNVGSRRVLLHNGFTPFGRSSRSFELAGNWLDLIHYECRVSG
jgi:[ribosomal protein S5]-alanine N-acetyltransferase